MLAIPMSSHASSSGNHIISDEPSIEAGIYRVEPAWIDCAGKTRSWSIHSPSGTKLGCVTTKRGATKIADLLTRFVGSEQAL